MSVMSIRIPDEKRKKLKVIASLEGKTMSGLVTELIDGYVYEAMKRLQEKSELEEIMAASEKTFSEWENEEDEVYNDL
jgi:predicted DNA-binding protein